MASSLAATIENAFEVEVALIEGHDGIFEVTLDGSVVHSNNGQCSQGFPADGEIVEQLSRLMNATPKVSEQPGSQNSLE